MSTPFFIYLYGFYDYIVCYKSCILIYKNDNYILYIASICK